MRRKFQHFILFLLVINCSWAYGVSSQVVNKYYSRNGVGADPALTIDDDLNPGPCTLDVHWTCSNCDTASFDGYNITWQQTGKDKESAPTLVSYRSSDYTIKNLISDQPYTVWVTVVIDDEETTISDSVEGSTKKGVPEPVTGVKAEQVSDSVIKVSWAKTTNECPIQGYYVTWNGTSQWEESFKDSGHYATDKTTMEAENLQPYFTYDFSVSEVTTDTIIGEPSDPVPAETKEGAASPPVPVTSLALGSYSAQVNWSLPETPNGVILGYCVKYQILPDEKVDCDQMVNDPDTFSITLTDLEACGDYTFSVQAINGYEGGFGEPGTDSSRTDPEPPPHFTNFNHENLTSTSVVLTWDPLDTNCPVTKYSIHGEEKVLWKEDATDSFDNTFPDENNYYLLENLIPYSQYDITIRATTEGGTTIVADSSDKQQFVTKEGEADAPSFINSSTIDSHTVSLNWSPPENINGKLTGYVICHKKKEDKISDCPINIDEKTLQYDVEGLDACGDYTFTVQAENGAGKGKKASTESQTDNEKPGEIGNVNIVVQNSTYMTITFDAPDTSCEIRYDIEGVGTYQWSNESYDYKETLVVTSDGEYIVPNLIPYTSYIFNMSATTAGGTTGGVMFEGETEKDVPSEPNNLKATPLDSNRIQVTWDEPEYQNGKNLKSYYLTYGPIYGSQSDPIEVKKQQYIIGDKGHVNEVLSPCRTYTVRVIASNEEGNGTDAHGQATINSEAPKAVTKLKCTKKEAEEIELSWTVRPSSCRIKYYEIFADGDIIWGGATNKTVSVSNTPTIEGTYTLVDLIADTSYNITLSPANDAGLGEPTSCICKTIEEAPGAPENLKVKDSSKSSLEIQWDAPERKNGFLTRFKITWSDNDEDKDWVEASNDTNTYTYKIEDLDDETYYTIKVYAENNVGLGAAASYTKDTEKSHLGAILGTVIPVILIIIAVIAGVWYNKSSKKKKKNIANTDD